MNHAPPLDFQKIYQLAEQYSKASQILNGQMNKAEWGGSGPRLLVDSFAVELYLKCLFVLGSGTQPPREHNWVKLFEALDSHTQTAIRDAFSRIVNQDPVLSHLDIVNPEAVMFTDFNRSLEAASDTFDKRRYLFEAQPTSEWFYAHLLREAIRAVVVMDIRLLQSTIPQV